MSGPIDGAPDGSAPVQSGMQHSAERRMLGSMSKDSISIGIVEDDVQVRQSLARQVASVPDWRLVFAVGSLAEARKQAKVDLLLLDLGLPDGDGLGLIADAVRACTRVIVCTIMGDEAHVLAAIGRGASGYLLKDSGNTEMQGAIRAVLNGGAPITPSVASYLLARVRREEAERPASADASIHSLTPREREVLLALARGYSYSETADALGISTHTVGDHVKHIYTKLSVKSRAEAVFEAVQAGWLG